MRCRNNICMSEKIIIPWQRFSREAWFQASWIQIFHWKQFVLKLCSATLGFGGDGNMHCWVTVHELLRNLASSHNNAFEKLRWCCLKKPLTKVTWKLSKIFLWFHLPCFSLFRKIYQKNVQETAFMIKFIEKRFPIKFDLLNFIWFNYADGCNLFRKNSHERD